MRAQRIRVGASESPVVVIDDFSVDLPDIIETAASLAPYPSPPRVHYPGLRRIIRPADAGAFAYVERTLEAAAPFIGGGFDVDHFDLIEASFSLVTRRPETLEPVQRAPHFDSTDQKYLAVLHYLGGTDGSGTAFYRHRATGTERVTEACVDSYVSRAKQESPRFEQGYVTGSNAFYEQIGAVEAVPNRLIVYQGSLLHSGIVPTAMSFSADPRIGRLTANIFVRAH
jgi:hypothetical protein